MSMTHVLSNAFVFLQWEGEQTASGEVTIGEMMTIMKGMKE